MPIIARDQEGAVLVGRFDKTSPTLKAEVQQVEDELLALKAARRFEYVAVVTIPEPPTYTVYIYPASARPAEASVEVGSQDELAAVRARLAADAAQLSGARAADKVGEALERPAVPGAADDFDAL